MKTRVAKSPFECLWSFQCGGSIISVASTPNCSLIAAAAVDCKLYLLNSEGTLLWDKLLDNEAWAVSISADSGRIAVGTANKKPAEGSVYVFGNDGREVFKQGIGAPVWGVSLSKDGSVLAVTAWNNKVYRFVEKDGIYIKEYELNIGSKGLYGVSLSSDGHYCAVSSPENALVLLDNTFSVVKEIPVNTGLYGAKLSPSAFTAVVGCRGGKFLSSSILSSNDSIYSPRISSRPICGVSLSDDGKLFALGSFDGKVYLATEKGYILWAFETDGEVWSTSITADGSLVCVGSGDRKVYLLRNFCNCAVLQEIEAIEAAINSRTSNCLKARLKDLASLYLSYGLIMYGLLRLKEFSPAENALSREIEQEFLLAVTQGNLTCYEAHYQLANLYRDREDYVLAVRHYQEAINCPNLRSRVLNSMGDCFAKLGWETASLSCFSRICEQYLGRDEKRVIFNLARSYQDSEDFQEAIKHYQLLLSWDIGYRNALERLQSLYVSESPTEPPNQVIGRRTDYTGLTVSLLGADVPRFNEVDESLIPILETRAKELFIVPGERAKIQEAINVLTESNSLPSSQRGRKLGYDLLSYLKYDYSLPEDEIKKQLEMVNVLSIVLSFGRIKTALDIGAATGRYPTMLTSLGINAFGLDIELEAMLYAQRKKASSEYPYYCGGNALSLPFRSCAFDLITCMMGTFAHFPLDGRELICREMARVLCPGGLLVISTWDIEYDHLSFLSMYTQLQKEMIRRASLTRDSTSTFLQELGWEVLEVRPFALLPDLFGYELKFDELTPIDIRRIVEFDLAARATFPNFHGQMYLTCARKQ